MNARNTVTIDLVKLADEQARRSISLQDIVCKGVSRNSLYRARREGVRPAVLRCIEDAISSHPVRLMVVTP